MSDPTSRLNAALSGRYRIERELGQGGMATVYLARDEKHNRKVALKVLKPELAAVVGAERFLAEIKTTANLQHPHILPLFDSGEADSFLFYVMPYVEGETLRDRLDREHQLPVDEAVKIAISVAEALDYAHKQGVIHRDIKPANILLQSGKPVLSDFGIALAVGVAGGGRLTETGLSLGTPHYMSPEQATGDLSVGAATDIYALGCVLYEMLVGDPPHMGSTAQAILGKIVMGDADPVTKHRKSVPPNVDAAIRRSLEKLPADRFGSASELAKALGDPGFRHGELLGLGGAGAAGVGSWNRLTTATTALAAAMTLIAAWSLLRPEVPEPLPPVERFAVETYSGMGAMGWPSLLPDGSGMVYGVGQLLLRRWSLLDPVPISGTDDVDPYGTPVVSPSGDEVAFITRARELKVVPLAGGVARTLAGDAWCCTRWGTDGFVYFSPAGERNIRRVRESGGPVEEVTTRDDPGTQGDFQILAGGDVGVFNGNWTGTESRIDAIRLSTGERKAVTIGVRPFVTPAGHLVFARAGGQILAAPFDADAMELVSPPVPVVEGVFVTNATDVLYSVSPDGSLLYVEGGRSEGTARLAVVDLEGNQQTLPLGPRDFDNFGPSWSPDGASIAFASEDQIYTYNTVLNTTPRQITFDGLNSRPVYAPDGTRVAFSSLRDDTDGLDIFVKDLNDEAPPRPLVALDGNQHVVGWPADTLIVFERGQGGNRDLWLLDLSDPEAPEARPYLTSEADLQRMVVSPDGRLAAYRSDESGIDEIYVRSFPNPGERTLVSRGGGETPYWSSDGRTLYYILGNERPWVAARLQREPVVSVLSLDTLFTLPRLPLEPFPGAGLHPDGDRFVLAVAGSDANAAEDVAPPRLILVKNFFTELLERVPIP